MSERRRAVLTLAFQAGSRFETEAHNGLSHFVEHMLFRGTSAHPSSHRLATAFERLGGSLQAMTAADHGQLSINVPAQNLSQVILLVAEVCQEPLFLDLEIERGIIREEILEDYSDDGRLVDSPTLVRKLAFGKHGLGRPITGPLENVDTFTLQQLREHHQSAYFGGRAAVSVAGPVDEQLVMRQLEQAFGSLSCAATHSPQTPPEEQSAPQATLVKYRGSSQTSLALAYRCPHRTHPQEPALELLLRVLDDGMATRLYHEICDSRGLCYTVSASYETYQDAGLVEIEADTAHERSAVVLSHMKRVTDELCQEKVSQSEWERAMDRARWQYEAVLDDVDEMADLRAFSHLYGTSSSPGERISQLETVSRDDLMDVAQAVFVPTQRNFASVGSPPARIEKELEAIALSDTQPF